VRVTVCCSRAIVLVGLKAMRSTMFSPLEMPPAGAGALSYS